MIVMGGIIGSGIFINPYVVARAVHTPALIIGAWVAGGVIALLGAFAYAELAALRPEVGGQYAYLRDAYHPSVAFLYGWALLLIVQSGGMAAVAATFAKYVVDADRHRHSRLAARRRHAARPHAHQLPRRAQRQQHADGADAAEARRDRDADHRRRDDRRAARRRARDARRAAVVRSLHPLRRGDDAGDVRVRRLADGELRLRRAGAAAARSSRSDCWPESSA